MPNPNLLSLTRAGERRLEADEPLRQLVAETVSNGESDLEMAMRGSYDEDDFIDYYQEFCDKVLPRLSLADQVGSYRSANIGDGDEHPPERPSGIITTATDGLFDGARLLRRLPETHVSRMVLSGAAALELIRNDPDAVLGASDHTTLDSCRFAGAALAVSLQRELRHRSRVLDMPAPSFSLANESDLLDVYVGADFHGDFRMAVQPQLHGTPVDSGGHPLDFYPASPPLDYISGYHSIEPELMRDVVLHVLLLPDTSERDRLITRMFADAQMKAKEGKHYFGNFGDAGHGDGLLEAELLLDTVQDTMYYSKTHRYVVMPQSETRLRVDSLPGGIEFAQEYGKRDALVGESSRLFVPTVDLPLFTVALVDQAMRGSGRTSIAPHLRILGAASQLVNGVPPDTIRAQLRRGI